MKNRFYGDVNDYIKYGILDILSEKYQSIGINWYLTDDGHGKAGDGNRVHYIDKVKEWRAFNPRIFNALKTRLECNQRNISYCCTDKVFDFNCEFTELMPDNAAKTEYEILRHGWHERAKHALRKCDLIFFDPDIGVVDHLPKSAAKKSEYCLTKEIEEYDWCDWLIVIFPKHAQRYATLKSNPIVRSAEKKDKKVMVFLFGGMALIYISKEIQAKMMSRVFKEWDTKIDTKILIP
ncbi:MAG: hypothetical protein JW943_10385 [Deltaproteobacteria bacterium]|nr:hypothetical protein [Deltaproteobacteria bacterium]